MNGVHGVPLQLGLTVAGGGQEGVVVVVAHVLTAFWRGGLDLVAQFGFVAGVEIGFVVIVFVGRYRRSGLARDDRGVSLVFVGARFALLRGSITWLETDDLRNHTNDYRNSQAMTRSRAGGRINKLEPRFGSSVFILSHTTW